MTITLPIHPLKGVQLPVYRFIRTQDGRRYVDVEHPPGRYMRLPIEWTDRAPPLVPPAIEGREVRLSIPALLELAAAVQIALERRHGSEAASIPAGGPTLIQGRARVGATKPKATTEAGPRGSGSTARRSTLNQRRATSVQGTTPADAERLPQINAEEEGHYE